MEEIHRAGMWVRDGVVWSFLALSLSRHASLPEPQCVYQLGSSLNPAF